MRNIILLFVFFTSIFNYLPNAESQESRPLISNVGRAPFALAASNFQCSAFLKSIRKLPVWHIAFLYNTFGTNYRCYKKLIRQSKGRLATVEVNLINEPGHRNRRLGSYEFLHGISSPKAYEKLLISENAKLRQKFAKYVKPLKAQLALLPPNTQCLINPGLESNVSEKAGRVLIQWTREEFPNCRTVWNPLDASFRKQGSMAGADLLEGHGVTPPLEKACIFNLDGTDISFPSRKSRLPEGGYVEAGNSLQQVIATYAQKCEIVFLWTVEDNCNYDTRFVDPRRRDCRRAKSVFPLTAKEAEIAMKRIEVFTPYEWTESENASLNQCTNIKDSSDGSKSGFLMKHSHFSNRGGVIIFPKGVSASSVQVLSRGSVIDNYVSGGKYLDGRPLWRSNKSPLSYPYHVVVRAKVGKEILCYPLDNPKVRND